MMRSIKRVIDYLNLDYFKALELESDAFLLAVKSSFVLELESTEEGRKYLETCKRLNTKELDTVGFASLKNQLTGGGEK